MSIFRSAYLEGRQNGSALASAFWPIRIHGFDFDEEQAVTAFFDHLKSEMYRIDDHKGRITLDTTDAITSLVRTAKSATTVPLSNLIIECSKTFLNVDRSCIQRSLEFGVRLWLNIHVNSQSLAVGGVYPLETPLDWPNNISLEVLIRKRWPSPQQTKELGAALHIGDDLTAAYLVNVCGMSLQWTEYLTDHLVIDPKGKTLTVYKHKVYLRNQLRSNEPCPIPKDVLEEALDTLNILFPFGDPATKQLLTRHGHLSFYQLGNCKSKRVTDLGQYVYWREELETLVRSFNSPPNTWKQLATDRRNLMDWAAFWVTVMVAVLTVVTVPCSIIQAIYSVKAYHATIAQGSGR